MSAENLEQRDVGSATTPVSTGRVCMLALVLGLSWLPVLFGYEVVHQVSALYDQIDSVHPYWVPRHAVLLYGVAPLVVLSASILFLSPGLLLALVCRAGTSLGQWLGAGLALSTVMLSLLIGVMQFGLGIEIRGHQLLLLVLSSSLVCLVLLLIRAAQGQIHDWPLRSPGVPGTLLSSLVLCWLLQVGLTPKLYWENFNDDGAHAFEASRLLLVQPLPFWPEDAGEIASFPGTNTFLFAYPNSWYLRLFGECEASVRLPMFLYLMVLHGLLLALIEQGKEAVPSRSMPWLVGLALATFTVVMAFSATYNPYCADLAMPGVQYTLLMIWFLGYTLAFLRQQRFWTWIFVLLTMVTAPNGVQLIGLWLIAVLLVQTPRPWCELGWSVGCLGSCLVLLSVMTAWLRYLGQPIPGGEHGLGNLLAKLAFLRLDDWQRWAFLLLPTGILPALTLLLWWKQDSVSRIFTILCWGYFLFFYFQAYVALHYFVPVMILPVVVFWRMELASSTSKRVAWSGCALLGGVMGLLLSLPSTPSIYTEARFVGETIDNRLQGYDKVRPAIFRHASLLKHLFPDAAQPQVPEKVHGGSPLLWNHYSFTTSSKEKINYVLQSIAEPQPEGMRLLTKDEAAGLYVNCDQEWAKHRVIRPNLATGSPWYMLPRTTLFRWLDNESESRVIRLERTAQAMGLNKETMLRWVGKK